MGICRCSPRGRGEFFCLPRPSLRLRGSGVTPMLAMAATGMAHGMVAASCVILIDLVIQIVSWFLCLAWSGSRLWPST